MMPSAEVDASRVLEIIKEENPLVLELAIRRARIEQLEAQLEEKMETSSSAVDRSVVPSHKED